MPRPARKSPTTRLSFDVAEPIRHKIESLRDVTHADSMTEVVRHALDVYEFVCAEKSKGKIIVEKPSGDAREVVFI